MRMLSLSNVRTSLTVILTLLAISCGGGGGGDDGGDIDTLGQSDLIRNTPTVFNGTAIPVATEPPLTANPAPEQAADLNILLDISGLPGIPGGFYDRVLGLGTLDLSGQNLVASGSSPGFGSFLRNQNFANILRNANPATPFDVFNPFARFEAERFANGLSSATANRSTSMVQAIHAQAQQPDVFVGHDPLLGLFYAAQYYGDGSVRVDFYADSDFTIHLGFFAAGILWNNGVRGNFPARVLLGYDLLIRDNHFLSLQEILVANNAGNGTYREVFVSSTATLTVELSHESESTVGTVTLSKAGGEGVEYNVVNESGVGLSVEILSTTGASGLLTVLDDRSGSLFLFNERDDVILSWSWNSNGAGTAELADGTAIEFRSFEDWR